MIRRLIAWLRRKPEVEVDEHAVSWSSEPTIITLKSGETLKITFGTGGSGGRGFSHRDDPADREGA